jgi:hypothetical protein
MCSKKQVPFVRVLEPGPRVVSESHLIPRSEFEGLRPASVRRNLGRGRSLALAFLAAALFAGISAPLPGQPAPSPGVPDYHITWTLDAVGAGEWQFASLEEGATQVSSRFLAVHSAGQADIDVDSSSGNPRADPFSVTGSWDDFETDTLTYVCGVHPTVVYTSHHVYTISPSASQPREDFFISVGTAPDGLLYVRDPFANLPPFPASLVTTITGAGADCNGPISFSDTQTYPSGFSSLFTPGDIPATNAEGTHFSVDRDFTAYVDIFNEDPIVFHWHVEIIDLHECSVEVCDGVDNDCDGQIDEDFDVDKDTYTTCGDVTNIRTNGLPGGWDCNDGDSATHPDASEECDGIDNDCEPATPDGSAEPTLGNACDDTDADLCPEGILVCSGVAGLTCDDPNDADPDVCNGIDDDCDSSTPDGSAEPTLGNACDDTDADLCPEGVLVFSGVAVLTCDDPNDADPDVCNGIDDDCDPFTPDGSAEPTLGNACDGTDADLCPEGILVCGGSAGLTCNDLNDADPETCDGLDNDCDGAVDEGGVCASAPLLTSLSPAKVWVGLQDNADAGIRFDLAAKVYLNNVEVGSGQLDSVAGGLSGFDRAKLDSIKLNLAGPVAVPPGSSFRIEVSVRNACRGSGKSSGRATLWYNGQPIDHGPRSDAGSRFDAKIGGAKRDFFLRQSAALSTTPGSSRLSVDQDAESPCSSFKSFGSWTTTLP